MKNLFNKIKQFIINHKTGSVIILIIILALGYWGYKKTNNTDRETRYITSKVEKNTVVASIAGTGQVSASNKIELKSKVSGDIVYLPVVNGQKVNTGTVIAQLDTIDIEKDIRDAKVGLEEAKLSLEKLKIQSSNENMNSELTKAYDDGFTAVSNTFLDLPDTITTIEDMLNYSNLSENTARMSGNTAVTYRKKAETSYYLSRNAFNQNKKDFQLLNRDSEKIKIDEIIGKTYNTVKTTTDAIKDLQSYVDYLADDLEKTSDYASYRTTLSTSAEKINGHLEELVSSKTNIKNKKDTFLSTDLDIKSAELSIVQKENALQDAKDKLSDYYVKAPFSGTISSVAVEKSDSVSSGTTIATLITDKQIAELSLNEVDVAKINIGQKANLSFDAVPDLTINGKVAEIDSVGTVSSGVVNYIVKINFDTSDARVKPGMSVNATIITNTKQDVLTVPNNALKSKNGTSYVETFDKELIAPLAGVQGSPSSTYPNKKNVVLGISNDTITEIISGLSEGDIIVIKTINGTSSVNKTPNIFGAVGGNKNQTGGNNLRGLR